MGKKTTTVVRVEAVMEREISAAPPIQASRPRLLPSALWVKMFSSTTMELSTIMPTPMAMPPRLIMLSVMSSICMSKKTEMMHTGMETAMTRVAPPSRRKKSSTMAASGTHQHEVSARRCLAERSM